MSTEPKFTEEKHWWISFDDYVTHEIRPGDGRSQVYVVTRFSLDDGDYQHGEVRLKGGKWTAGRYATTDLADHLNEHGLPDGFWD